MKTLSMVFALAVLLVPLRAQNQGGWDFNFTPFSLTMHTVNNNQYIDDNYIGLKPIKDGIGANASASYKTRKWRIGIQTDYVETWWNIKFEPKSDFPQESNLRQFLLRGGNDLDIRTHALLLGYEQWENLELTIGLRYANIINTQHAFQTQIMRFGDPETVYGVEFTFIQDSKATAYATGPAVGLNFQTEHINAAIQQAVMLGDIKHVNSFSVRDKEIWVVYGPDISYMYLEGDEKKNRSWLYEPSAFTVTDIRVGLFSSETIFKKLNFNIGVNTSVSILWQMPMARKWDSSTGSSLDRGQWTLQYKTLTLVNFGFLSLGINF